MTLMKEDTASYKLGLEHGKADPQGIKGPSRKVAYAAGILPHGFDGYAEAYRKASAEAGKLQAAISALGAVEVAPGRYAFESGEKPRWFITDRDGLLWQAGITYESGKDESWWGRFTLMPSWWTPELRERFVKVEGDRLSLYCQTCGRMEPVERLWADRAGKAFEAYTCKPQRITADLETGEEIPA